MIEQVLDYVNNYFVNDIERTSLIFDSSSISGTFSKPYLVGQYVCIEGSVVNDGVYKITAVEGGKLTLDTTSLIASAAANVYVLSLAIPRKFLDIVTSVNTYNQNNMPGLKSESQGNRSVSYNGDSGWVSTYKLVLAPYKRVYSDKLAAIETLGGYYV